MRTQLWSAAKEKWVKQLHKKKQRKLENLFILEGYRAIEQAISNKSLVFDAVIVTEAFQAVVHTWTFENQPEPKLFVLNQKQMNAITTTEQAPGCMAICEIPAAKSFADFSANTTRLVALDRIQDPGNLGTIARTALWFGWDGLILGEGTVDLFNPKVVRSTVGASGSLAYHLSSKLGQTLDDFEKNGWVVNLLDLTEDSIPLKEGAFNSGKQILVLGNEANGVDTSLRKLERPIFHIQGKNQHLIESLNASVALGISLYHFS
jgi:TrmH family RNA methyltransferase